MGDENIVSNEVKKEEVKQETAQPQETQDLSMVDKAMQTADRLERENKRFEELLKQQEALIARQMLAGRSQAGQPQKTKEETEREEIEAEAKKLMIKFIPRGK